MTSSRGRAPLYAWILLGFLIGLGAGLYVNLYVGAETPWVQSVTQNVTGPIGQIFLKLLFMLVIPLLFSALAVGVAEMGDLSTLGRVGFKTLAFTIVLSATAVLIGLVMVNAFRPGAGVDPALASALLEQSREAAGAIVGNAPKSIEAGQFFLDLIPSNVVTAAAENQILPVMVFALFFGIGLVMARSVATDRLQESLQGLFEVMMKLINLVIKLAPIAIACLMFNLAALFGWDLLVRLAGHAAGAIGAMAIHVRRIELHRRIMAELREQIDGWLGPAVASTPVREAAAADPAPRPEPLVPITAVESVAAVDAALPRRSWVKGPAKRLMRRLRRRLSH